MNDALTASDALLNYIDSLLLTTECEGDGHNENTVNTITTSDCVESTSEAIKLDHIQNDLQLLLFNVSGISLAISNDSLSNFVAVDRRNLKCEETKNGITRMVFNYRGQGVQVLETRNIIIPNDHPTHRLNDDSDEDYVLVFKGQKYGLLCDGVGEQLNLGYQDVEWREQRVSRPWLAGIVKGKTHVLLDHAVIIDMCEQNKL